MLEGETLFNQGDKGDKAYMIVSGALDVIVDGKKVGSMRDGEVFGEMALILQQNRSATITSSQSTELISISKENLDELINSGSKEAQKVILNLCKELAKRNIRKALIINGTIPHTIIGKHGSSRILLKPASPGTGIIAGAAVRSVMEQVGINNILTKRQGSKNTMNLVHATVSALFNLKDAVTIANKRGISLKKVFN